MPATFGGDRQWDPDVYVPLSRGWTRPDADRLSMLNVIARLTPGTTVAAARAEVQAIAARLHQDDLDRFPMGEAYVYPVREESQSTDLNSALYLLLGAVGLVLLTGCANLGNLTLARTIRRSREIAVRRALGASRGDIVRQLITESLCLAAAGGAAGLVIAYWLTRGLLLIAPSSAARAGMGQLSIPVFLFALLVSGVAVVLFGLAPALSGSATDVNAALKSGDRGGTASRHRSRQLLMAAEVAMALLLLTGAGLLLRSFARVVQTDLGFTSDQRVVVDIELPPADYPDPPARARLLDRYLATAPRDAHPVRDRGAAAASTWRSRDG
jgi:hypothetical protein